MALMMEVRIEENRKELSIVIWDEDDSDKFATQENRIINLKIPLETSNKIVDKLCGRFALSKAPSKDKNRFINEISDFSNEEKCVKERPENRREEKNSEVFEIKKYSKREKHANLENKENINLSVTDSVLDFKDVDRISNYLDYVDRKSEAFVGIEYKSWNCHVTSKIPDINQTDGSSSENNYCESVIISPTKRRATDTMSNTSDDDDYTLMIDDDSTERSDKPQKVEIESVLDVSQRKEPPSTFHCQSYDDVFSKKRSRRLHVIAIQNMKFTCPICGSMFSMREQLLLHLRVHGSKKFSNRDSPSLTHSCSHCNRKYRSSKALKEHTKSHAPIQSRFFWKVSDMNANSSKRTEVNSAASNFPV